ncbi:MAG: ABC transporter substrate-binding protein [Firmicutes bacterium]|nr:ABC transporter substrate-binding protein [Bacillota bacterium]
MKKNFLKLMAMSLVSVMALCSFAGCGGDAPADDTQKDGAETFKIGMIGPLTGAASSYGISVQQGCEVAVAEINANGGVAGYQFELLPADDQHDAEKAINAYGTLMDQGMNALVGTVTSVPCIAVTEESTVDGLLQITPSASAAKAAQYDNCFRICFTDPQQGEHMANYIAGQGIMNCAVLYDVSDAYSSGIYEAFVPAYEALGGTVTTAESFASGDVDFKTQLTSVKNSGAEGLFMPFYYTEVAYVANQAVDVGLDVPFFGCDGWDGVIAQLNGDTTLVDGSVFLTPFLANATDDKTVAFVEAYQAAYGTAPDQFAADGYDAVYAVAAALEKAGTVDNAALVAAMHEIELAGVTGTMTWDENGDANKGAILAKIQDGGVVPAE